MRKGQRIRFRASDLAAQDWGVAVGAEGTVLCSYRVVRTRALGQRATEYLDVKFSPGTVVWGAPVAAFEEISEAAVRNLPGRGARGDRED